jgi:hypothetical protein
MCNPALAGLALMAVGTGVTVHGQKKAEKAALNVRRMENDRQKKHQGEAETAFAGNEAALNADTIKGNMRTNAATREGAYAAANSVAPNAVQQAASSAMGSNKVVNDNLGHVLKGAGSRVAAQGAARADLGSFGDTMFDASILTNRGRQGIQQAGNFAQGSANVVGSELEAAKHKGANQRMLGSVLTAVGGAMMGGAGMGAGAGAGAASSGITASQAAAMAAAGIGGIGTFAGGGNIASNARKVPTQGFVGPPG